MPQRVVLDSTTDLVEDPAAGLVEHVVGEVRSARSALSAFRRVGFSGPSPEPDVSSGRHRIFASVSLVKARSSAGIVRPASAASARALLRRVARGEWVASLNMTATGSHDITHLGLFFRQGNAGDTAMRAAVKRFLSPDSSYLEINVRTEIGHDLLEQINRTRLVVVGGGGLFWDNPRLNHGSGWQWNIDDDTLRSIRPPIVLFAVGDSSFAGESIDSPRFRRSMSTLQRHGALFGFRNHGSYRSVAPCLGRRSRARSFFQPCPTMFLRHYWDDTPWSTPKRSRDRLKMAVNIPLDRPETRYRHRSLDHIITAIAGLCDEHDVEVAAHIDKDAEVSERLEAAGAPHGLVRLHGRTPAEIVDYYRDVDVSVGGRGHALMIPFGLGVPAVGLASHAKVTWLAETSQGAIECVDVSDLSGPDIVRATVDGVVANLDRAADRVSSVSSDLFELSTRNRSALLELAQVSKLRRRNTLTPIA